MRTRERTLFGGHPRQPLRRGAAVLIGCDQLLDRQGLQSHVPSEAAMFRTSWNATRKPCCFVTHDIEEAIFLGSRVIVMSAHTGCIKAGITARLSDNDEVPGSNGAVDL
jgi:hypothetical protein